MQPIPGLPEAVKNEGTSAVLWLVLVGVATAWYIIRQAPAIILAWKAQGARETETARLESAQEALRAEIATLHRAAVEHQASQRETVAALLQEVAGLRQGIHGIRDLMGVYEARLHELEREKRGRAEAAAP